MSMGTRSIPRLAVCLLLSGCLAAPSAPIGGPRPDGGRTAGTPLPQSGRTAWDLLRLSGMPLDFHRDDAGSPSASRRRGFSSRHGEVLLVMDGQRVPGLGVLEMVPAEMVESIRLVSDIGDPQWGALMNATDAEAVIELRTRRRGR
jgi:hypothetical protein